MRWYDVHEVQIPGKKIEPKRPLLDTLILVLLFILYSIHAKGNASCCVGIQLFVLCSQLMSHFVQYITDRTVRT